jgi:hypothetical protein
MDKTKRVAICIDTDGYDESLDLRKAYPVIDDPDAERTGMLRIIDETGEDYLFGVSMFIVVTASQTDVETLHHLMETPVSVSR